jgi:hypothetical protein
MNAKTRTSLGKALAIFTAVFGSGLTFFLVRATFLDDAK